MRIRQDLHLDTGYDTRRHKMCVEMKEQAQAQYFGTILAIPVPV